VDHHGVQADELQQHGVGGELLRHGLLAHGVAAVFDDHGLAVVDLDVGQGLGQGVGGGPAGFGVEAACGGFGFLAHGRPHSGNRVAPPWVDGGKERVAKGRRRMRRITASGFDAIGLRVALWAAVAGMIAVLTWCVWGGA
jgi:hypothetical protein